MVLAPSFARVSCVRCSRKQHLPESSYCSPLTLVVHANPPDTKQLNAPYSAAMFLSVYNVKSLGARRAMTHAIRPIIVLSSAQVQTTAGPKRHQLPCLSLVTSRQLTWSFRACLVVVGMQPQLVMTVSASPPWVFTTLHPMRSSQCVPGPLRWTRPASRACFIALRVCSASLGQTRREMNLPRSSSALEREMNPLRLS